jgi:hypothetical protein
LRWAWDDDDAGDGGERRRNEFAEKKKWKRKRGEKRLFFKRANENHQIIKSSFSIEIILLPSSVMHFVLSILSFCKWLDKQLSPIDLNALQHYCEFLIHDSKS